jgi:hypothetical protein
VTYLTSNFRDLTAVRYNAATIGTVGINDTKIIQYVLQYLAIRPPFRLKAAACAAVGGRFSADQRLRSSGSLDQSEEGLIPDRVSSTYSWTGLAVGPG